MATSGNPKKGEDGGGSADALPQASWKFDDYLKEEYRQITEAHFKTIEAISSFFRYYLLLMSFPVTLIGLFTVLSLRAEKSEELGNLLSRARPFLVGILLVVSLTGIGMMVYIINLRMDAILYARTINAIRKRFYDNSGEDFVSNLRTRVLPQSPFQPAYREGPYFVPVVLTFALFNTFYFSTGLFLPNLPAYSTLLNMSPEFIGLLEWCLIVVYFFSHIAIYHRYAYYREHGYLRSHVLGVDIDGVLNKHREHFCKLLERNTGKILNPDSIKGIPLHEYPQLGISRQEERQVFHDPLYWIQMPCIDGAEENLRKLRNAFKLKVRIFSYRPWPDVPGSEPEEYERIRQAWCHETSKFIGETYGKWSPITLGKRLFLWSGLTSNIIKQMTLSWLRANKLKYNSLLIERGNENTSDPQIHFRNRFYIARKKKIRFFVEDDWEKARKFAYICDVVFLLDQPYNRINPEYQRQAQDLPGNIIRVQSWDEIYRHVRKLS